MIPPIIRSEVDRLHVSINLRIHLGVAKVKATRSVDIISVRHHVNGFRIISLDDPMSICVAVPHLPWRCPASRCDVHAISLLPCDPYGEYIGNRFRIIVQTKCWVTCRSLGEMIPITRLIVNDGNPALTSNGTEVVLNRRVHITTGFKGLDIFGCVIRTTNLIKWPTVRLVKCTHGAIGRNTRFPRGLVYVARACGRVPLLREHSHHHDRKNTPLRLLACLVHNNSVPRV